MKVTQISCFIENRPGRLHAACDALAGKGINIHTLSLADTAEFGILRLIVSDPAAGKAVLDAAGYVTRMTDVVAVEVPDDAGGLAHILAQADVAELNIEYMYAFTFRCDGQAVLLFRFNDADAAIASLQARGVNVIGNANLFSQQG